MWLPLLLLLVLLGFSNIVVIIIITIVITIIIIIIIIISLSWNIFSPGIVHVLLVRIVLSIHTCLILTMT